MDEQADGAHELGLDETLRRIEVSWGRWLESFAGIAGDRLSEPGACGGWSIKDLIGHVAYWDADALADIERIITGGSWQPQDVEARNAAAAAANAGRGLTDLQTEMDRTHQAVIGALRGLAPNDPRTRQICREIAEDTWQHYDEHTAHVRAWRTREGI